LVTQNAFAPWTLPTGTAIGECQAINQLPLQQQRVYKLAKEQHLSYEAIAQELSLSPLTVKTHMARALDAIRSYLKRHGEVFLLLLLVSR